MWEKLAELYFSHLYTIADGNRGCFSQTNTNEINGSLKRAKQSTEADNVFMTAETRNLAPRLQFIGCGCAWLVWYANHLVELGIVIIKLASTSRFMVATLATSFTSTSRQLRNYFEPFTCTFFEDNADEATQLCIGIYARPFHYQNVYLCHLLTPKRLINMTFSLRRSYFPNAAVTSISLGPFQPSALDFTVFSAGFT